MNFNTPHPSSNEHLEKPLNLIEGDEMEQTFLDHQPPNYGTKVY